MDNSTHELKADDIGLGNDGSMNKKIGLNDEMESKSLVQNEDSLNDSECENTVNRGQEHEEQLEDEFSLSNENEVQSPSSNIKGNENNSELNADPIETDVSSKVEEISCESKLLPVKGLIDTEDSPGLSSKFTSDLVNARTNAEFKDDNYDAERVSHTSELNISSKDEEHENISKTDVESAFDSDNLNEMSVQNDNEDGTHTHLGLSVDSADGEGLIKSSKTTEEIKSETDKINSNTSAFQRLASLGVIPEEKPIVEESKESALKKLVSRGTISITPAGGGSPILPSKKSISVIPAKPRPGPKSAMLRQKAKKIKIDPGKSLDIDKDFNSLISFLSSGNNATKTPDNTSTPTNEEKHESKTNSEDVSGIKSDNELEINDTCIDQSTNDGHGSGMDVDICDERSTHETDSESHDGSKAYSHYSDHAEENEESMQITSSKIKTVIEEGSAEILLSATKNVFYNKVQEFNRDMSIAALTVFSEMHQQDPRNRNRGKKRKALDTSETDTNNSDDGDGNVFEAGKKSQNGITILEALSATGLRSIRYAREIPGVKQVIANDLSQDAVETIKTNIEHNGVDDLVTTTMSDASLLMYQHLAKQEWYDAVDLDPFGCPSRFLDSAVQAVRDGGLLLVTCTDMGVLAGGTPETCYIKYGAISLRSPACHEMALRIALQCIESHANRYGRYIVPLLSFSADFYIRLIVQVYTSPVTCKKTTSKLSMVYQCVGCNTQTLHPLGQTSQVGPQTQTTKFSLAQGPPVNMNCFHCHHKHLVGGPIWSAPMYSSKFLESMLRVVEKGQFGTFKRMQGMLEVIREELPDAPLYYTISGLCIKLHCQAIPLIDIRSAILNAGYRVSSSHASPTAIKTNAPAKIIWDIMRCWVHMNPVSQKRLLVGSVPAAIILEPPNLIANFDIHPKARPSSSMRKLLRYQQNPEKNWGPGMRARCNNTDDLKDDKQRANQNKNKNKKNIDIIEVVTIDDEDETAPTPESSATTSTS